MKNRFFLLLTCCFQFTLAFAQQKITLADIWQKPTFRGDGTPGFQFLKDGRHYLLQEKGMLVQYDITTGKADDTLFNSADFKILAGFEKGLDGYRLSEDEKMILLRTASEPIYRHSERSRHFVYDRSKAGLDALFAGSKQVLAEFSPKGDQVAFVADNNLYVKSLVNGQVTQITRDGKTNSIINGATDWVYEEEFGFTQAFSWAPDGSKISFLRFDESEVPQFNLEYFHDGMYPEPYQFKYPKVGEKNAVVTPWIYDLASDKTIAVDLGKEADMYIPRLSWTLQSNQAVFYYLNRHQNDLRVMLTDAASGQSRILLQEKSQWYVDVHDNLRFLQDGKSFLWTSERSGYNHIYLYGMDGKLIRPITQGKYEVTQFYGVDEKNKKVYYQADVNSPMSREVYEVGLDGKKQRLLTPQAGFNRASFSSTFDYWVWNNSRINDPGSAGVYDRSGKEVRALYDNAKLKAKMESYQAQPVEFFSFAISDSISLNGWMIKPAQLKPGKSNPVFMTLYGGPGSQEVTDDWMGANYWWYQLLVQEGYIVACVDNRGTGGRGEWFKKMTYLQLGHYETEDQISAAKYLGGLPYVDPARIGIFGWSYGGYMSSLCILKGNDVFKAAIAVAPVTNWKWYDSIYTERYMRSYAENKSGYDDNSPIHFADRLKGNYLLVHGMADDNVHFQNTVEMTNALIDANKQFDTYFYPNRNHGIYGGNARIHLYTKMTRFIEEKL